MTKEADIARIIEQEDKLVFDSFDEETALALGLDIKQRCEALGRGVYIDIRFWDRSLFTFAMKGTTDDNAQWVRRKVNSVKRFQRPSYRLKLERSESELKPNWGLDFADYVFAGGCFPIRVIGAGGIGCVTVSGLPGRDDHELVVSALCQAIGVNYDEVALGPE